ncbi:MAG: META domain-containing protein [Ardenticatenaceae bacterium]|nr:META domain-containing protein [Ardenticatenaceae bacterium]
MNYCLAFHKIKHVSIIIAFVFLFSISACKQQGQNISDLVSESSWTISDIISTSETPPPTALIDREVTFTKGGLEISGPCNQIGGFFAVDETGQIIRSEVHMTLIDCQSLDDHEAVLLQYFRESNQLIVDDGTMIMKGSQGEVHFAQSTNG